MFAEIISVMFLFCGIAVISAAIAAVNVVPTGRVRIISRFGKVHRTLNPGISFSWPLIEKPVKMQWQMPVTPVGDRHRSYWNGPLTYIPTREVRHDPAPYRVVIKEEQIKFVDLNFYSQINDTSKAMTSHNLWKNLEDHVHTTVVNLCRQYVTEMDILGSLKKDLLAHPEIKEFCNQYGIEIVSLQIQSIKPTDDIIRLHEASAAKILMAQVARSETDAEASAQENRLRAKRALQKKEHDLNMVALEEEAALGLAKLDASIVRERRERALQNERSQTDLEKARSKTDVGIALERGIHQYHLDEIAKLKEDQRAGALQTYYFSHALAKNSSITHLTMCSHVPYGTGPFGQAYTGSK